MTTLTPLRYPGGKSRLTPFVEMLMEVNGLTGGHYVEPYAGGAGLAISLLVSGHASKIHINDLNPAVFAFWKCVFGDTDKLCALIRKTPVTMKTWAKQKAVLEDAENQDMLSLGFAAFFLNRTNRSGILTGGVIGGKEQLGKWGIGARFHKENLCLKIERAAGYASQVEVYSQDAEVFLRNLVAKLPKKSFIYLDPPYYVKSKRLYKDLYSPDDHARIAKFVQRLKRPWMISYDDVPAVRELYTQRRLVSYALSYSAATKYRGDEALFFSDGLSGVTDILPWQSPKDRNKEVFPERIAA